MKLAYDPRERHPLVCHFGEHFLPEAYRRFDAAVAAGDEMYGFAFNEQYQHRGLALIAYLRSGWLAWQALEQILRWRYGAPDEAGELLDVASGFGRMTRFLLQAVPAERLTISEINGEALRFQTERYGVAALASSADPAQFACPQTFGCVSAFSLLTHLPEPRFLDWLGRLWELVSPGGVLVITTNGPTLLPAERRPADDQLRFERVSEIAALSLDDYGSTWVGEAYVRAAIAARCPGAFAVERVERGLWACQDLYVICRDQAPQEPLRFSIEPLGFIDTAYLHEAGSLTSSGWAIDRDRPGSPVEIRLQVAGVTVGVCETSIGRDDIASVHGEAYRRAGWVWQGEAPTEPWRSGGFPPSAPFLVTATGVSGRPALIHLSSLEGADLRSRAAGSLEEIRQENLVLRHRIGELERRIATMEQSRFWKLRNSWWRLRGGLGV